MRCALVAFALLLAGCSSGPERKVDKFDANVDVNAAFRLGAKGEGVEIRVESGFYPTGGYDLIARVEGSPSLSDGITIVLEGVQEPLEPKGDRCPASALVFVPLGKSIEGTEWSLTFKVPNGNGDFRKDSYTVMHTAAGWRGSPRQGAFSRFDPQGSF
jgi:hypothetical protein